MQSPNGQSALVDFASYIDEESYDVLTPKVSDKIGAIQTSVKPWVFVCNSCGRVRQYYSYDEFKRREFEPCKCGRHMTQLRLIRFCRCGYADGIFVPKCSTPGHGTKYMTRRGSIAKYIFVSIGGEIMDAFTEEELRFLAELRMWPPRRSPWTAEELRNLLKIARITFPEAFENINQEV